MRGSIYYYTAKAGGANLYMKISRSPASLFPQREQASMAQRQVSPQSSGSIWKNEEEEEAIIFRVSSLSLRRGLSGITPLD